MLTASRRIGKCPGQRFSDKFPTAGTDRMTNARGDKCNSGICEVFASNLTDIVFSALRAFGYKRVSGV